MATKARQQYHADETTLSKERREFSISDDVQEKIDGIEEGAQVNTIETIRVNGNEISPDENKAIDLTIPGVIDSLSSTSITDALSARQGKILYDKIDNISRIGHFLALWDASTGLPVTDPEVSPYEYHAGDFYTISVVASQGGTNYKPSGTEYISGQASTAVETDDVEVNDFYFYDGQAWRHMKNSGAGDVVVDGSLSTTSRNPVENRVITNALSGKQNTLTAGANIQINGNTISATDTKYTAGTGISIANGVISNTQTSAERGNITGTLSDQTDLQTVLTSKATDANVVHKSGAETIAGTKTFSTSPVVPSKTTAATNTGTAIATEAQVYKKQDTLVSGTNIKTINSNSLLGSGNITLNDVKSSATAPSSPTEGMLWYDTTNDVLKAYNGTQWNAVDTNTTYNAGEGIEIGTYNDYSAMRGPCPRGFHVPTRSEWESVISIGTALSARSTTGECESILNLTNHNYINYTNGSVDSLNGAECLTCNLVPSTNNAYIFSTTANQIRIYNTNVSHGTQLRPFKDVPVTPDNSWTTLYDGSGVVAGAGIFSNTSLGLISLSSDGVSWITIAIKNLGAADTTSAGYYYQRGNNNGFVANSYTTSSTAVDANNYGPGNYYSSNVFIQTTPWCNPINRNLRGGVVGVVTLNNAISNTGVLSVNGKTGYVAVKEYNEGEGIEIGTYNDYSAMRGPCPDGYHIPLITEWGSLKDVGIALGAWTSSTGGNMIDVLRMPSPGFLRSSAGTKNGSTSYCYYMSSSSVYSSLYIYKRGNINTASTPEKTEGHVLRPFKDEAVIPDNSWTTLYDGSNVATGAGIFHNAASGLISISADGINWTTIADKNLGATTVYNYGDTLSQDNCGGFFQWGNNYMFPYTGATTTSDTQVDASNYGPGNYYSSSTFITRSASPYKWDSSDNPNLRGGETGVVTLDNAINNDGVLSVNGKSGDISISSGEGIEISVDNVVSANIGEGLKIGTYKDYSAMRGPCEEGYHIPTRTEFTNIKSTLVTTLGLEDGIETLKNYLKMAPSGSMTSTGGVSRGGGNMEYWSCSASLNTGVAFRLHLLTSVSDTTIKIDTMNKNYLYTIRPFKDEAVIPDNSWTTLYDGSSVATGAGVFYNSDKGLISISGDGINWTTIADKNLGAIVAYNNGDVLNDQNCGGYFMRGNNYMFMPDRQFIKSSTAIDASSYGPGNYYYSNVYIDTAIWDTSRNSNLRGGVTGLIITDNTINNSGVLSVNGRTGYVKIKEYNAGSGINIESYRDCSAMRGPCPKGFHIMTKAEGTNLINAFKGLGLNGTASFRQYFKVPTTGQIIGTTGQIGQSTTIAEFRLSEILTTTGKPMVFEASKSYALACGGTTIDSCSIRPYKDVPVAPDNSWTILYDGSSTSTWAGIFHNSTLGLISISSDGTNWITIADKNLGATVVYNEGDAVSEINAGKLYQWGNNYGFPLTGATTTSSTKVDTTGYGPGNYYTSSTFITVSNNNEFWTNPSNPNLRGGLTGVVTLNNAISNTGVLSVNGQTGDVTLKTINNNALVGSGNISLNVIFSGAITPAASSQYEGKIFYNTADKVFYTCDGTQWSKIGGGGFELAPNSPLSPKYRWYGTQAQYDALTQYYTDEVGDTVYYTI